MVDAVEAAALIMASFAARTGINSAAAPRRYLWTDAFAVCNYLALHRYTHAPEWRALAEALIDQVHHVLGRHRADDVRTGWISGASEAEGERHPTAGGLRIGKPLPERGPNDPFDDRLEWERDGQYYHYLTRWLHALERCAAEWQDERLLRWGVELAQAAQRGFAHEAHGQKLLYWKMSIDLTRPLVDSMGQHDALDGLVAIAALNAAQTGDTRLDLRRELIDLADMCEHASWTTTDTLGLGLLLTDALFLSQLSGTGQVPEKLFVRALRAATRGLKLVGQLRYFERPAEERLPFRELGLSLGLAAVERLVQRGRTAELDELMQYMHLRDRIESFWLVPAHQNVDSWIEHEDINAVMLASSILPDGVLD